MCDNQIENEYGSYRSVDCGHDYMAHLHDLARHHLGEDIVLITTDGNSIKVLQCGATNDTYATVDFGPTTGLSVCLFTSSVRTMPSKAPSALEVCYESALYKFTFDIDINPISDIQ